MRDGGSGARGLALALLVGGDGPPHRPAAGLGERVGGGALRLGRRLRLALTEAADEAPLDADADGQITPSEAQAGRFAAALDRFDPTLFFGESRQVRLGIEVTF